MRDIGIFFNELERKLILPNNRQAAHFREMMLFNNIYGKQLRDARKKQKQRLVDVATWAGIDASYLSRIESGKRAAPNAEIQAAIAKALNLSFEETSALSKAAAIGRSKRPLIAPGSGKVVAVLMDEAMAIRLFGSLPSGSMPMPFIPQEKETIM